MEENAGAAMNIGAAHGKLFLLYAHAEEGNVRKMQKQLKAEGIIAIPCEDPANFRFVTPEVISVGSDQLDIIGRVALKNVGGYGEDSGTDVAMEAAKDVPLTAAEAKEFKDIPGVTVRPHTRAKIGDGKPADGKTPKDSKKK